MNVQLRRLSDEEVKLVSGVICREEDSMCGGGRKLGTVLLLVGSHDSCFAERRSRLSVGIRRELVRTKTREGEVKLTSCVTLSCGRLSWKGKTVDYSRDATLNGLSRGCCSTSSGCYSR